MQFYLLDAPFNSHTLSYSFLNKNLSREWGMGRGLAPSPFNFIKIKQHALKNINYENKLMRRMQIMLTEKVIAVKNYFCKLSLLMSAIKMLLR